MSITKKIVQKKQNIKMSDVLFNYNILYLVSEVLKQFSREFV